MNLLLCLNWMKTALTSREIRRRMFCRRKHTRGKYLTQYSVQCMHISYIPVRVSVLAKWYKMCGFVVKQLYNKYIYCTCTHHIVWYFCVFSTMSPLDTLMKNLNDMEEKYKKQIKKNLTLLIQTLSVIGVVVVMFFVSSLISAVQIDLGMDLTGLVDHFTSIS